MLALQLMDHDLATLFYVVGFALAVAMVIICLLRKLPEIALVATAVALVALPLAWNAIAT